MKKYPVEVTPAFIDLVLELHVYFSDARKVSAWLNTKNPNFGGVSAVQLIRIGRIKTVAMFVAGQREQEGW